MAKEKTAKGPKSAPNKHLHARVSFLYQAATYLTVHTKPAAAAKEASTLGPPEQPDHVGPSPSPLALQLASHLRGVSLKGQTRLTPDMKRSICKRCNSILVPGQTSVSRIENASRNGKKPCADVLILECTFCGAQKRFPVGSIRQPGKARRSPEKLGQTSASRSGDSAREAGQPVTDGS